MKLTKYTENIVHQVGFIYNIFDQKATNKRSTVNRERMTWISCRILSILSSLKHRMLSAGCIDKHETRLNLTTAKCTNTLHGLAPTLRALRATLHHRDM